MAEKSQPESAAAAMRAINRAWLDGRVEDIAPMVHADIVIALLGFAGRVQGREAFLAGFRDFRENATIHEFCEQDDRVDVDVAGDTAVATFGYKMVYERAGQRYRVTGRDLWVFEQHGGAWIAVWRAMLDMDEIAA